MSGYGRVRMLGPERFSVGLTASFLAVLMEWVWEAVGVEQGLRVLRDL